MPMGSSSSKARTVGDCGVAWLHHIHGCAVGCDCGWRGTDAGVEELHNVVRHEAHLQTVEQSGEEGVALLALGRFRIEYNQCGC